MKIIRITIILLLSLFITPSFACRCDEQPTVEDSYRFHHLIVYGRVIEKTFISISETIDKDSLAIIRESIGLNLDRGYPGLLEAKMITKIRLLVLKSYKNLWKTDTITILTPISGASCGYTRFKEGQEYIVYGYLDNQMDWLFRNDVRGLGTIENTYWTNHCTRTTEYIQSEIIALDKIEKETLYIKEKIKFTEKIKSDIENNKYTWIDSKKDIPKSVIKYINKSTPDSVSNGKKFRIVNPGEAFDCCCTSDHRLPPRQLILAGYNNNEWIIMYHHGQGWMSNHKILHLNIEHPNDISFFYGDFSDKKDTTKLVQDLTKSLTLEHLELFKGDFEHTTGHFYRLHDF
jgi:hypothetical protein